MAQIVDSSDEKVFRIQEFLGLNESPDGDTKLKLGEASVMRNFKITRDHSLQKRPGLDSIISVISGYTVKISETSQIVRTDNNVSSSLMMYPYYLSYDGEISVWGDMVSVEYSNAEEYSGYYWSGNDGNIYQFDRCERSYDSGNAEYLWYMRSMTLVPPGEAEANVTNLWSGNVRGEPVLVGTVGNQFVKLWDKRNGFVREPIGEIRTDTMRDSSVVLFGFSGNLYIMTGVSQYEWDGGEELKSIEYNSAYEPLVVVSIPPGQNSGGGTTLQQVNILSAYFRVRLSPDGEGTEFVLPGRLPSIPAQMDVVDLTTGEEISSSAFSFLRDINTNERIGIKFNDPPAAGENSIEIRYTGTGKSTTGNAFSGITEDLSPFSGMRYVELYNGVTDTRVFLYGDKTNKVYYSDFDENGIPRADYFPELNTISIGSENSSVTGLVRHYSRLIAFKEDEAYSIQYGTITLPDDTSTAAFYCTPINRNLGNEAMGQARLVLNSPYTLCGKDVYEWRNNASYSSNLSIDERQAKRISDRVYATLENFDFSRCYCYDDKDHQEYYICYDKKALVYNYAADAWYYYTDFDVTCMVNLNGDLYAGDSLGRLNLVSRNNRTDNGTEITGYWESGAEPFDREFMRKYSAIQWIVLKPELRSRVEVTVQTDRKSDHAKKVAAASVFSFSEADFRRWSFNTNRKPHAERLKIKAKKFVYYKLIFRFDGTNTTATVVAADMRVRYTGYAR